MKKKTARFLAAVLILAMMLGACSSAPKNNEDGTADGGDSEGAKDMDPEWYSEFRFVHPE